MNNFVAKALRSRKVLIGRDFYQSRQVKCPHRTYGNRFAEWTFCPDHMDKYSVVYSFGVGEDISFDLALLEHFGLHIHAFDPSPRSIEWIEQQRLQEEFHFYPFGLAGSDGTVMFNKPAEQGIRSLKMTRLQHGEDTKEDLLELPVHRLATIMRKLHHERVDLLKMDIEGAEYEVIDDILSSSLPITQLLIEFHHRFKDIGIGMTRRAIRKLNEAGYRIFHVSACGEEFSFIKTQV